MNVSELLKKRVKPIQETLEKIMVGQRHVIRRVTMAIFAVGQRDFHADGTRFLGTGHVLCEGSTGTGKCLGKGTPVLMFNGSTKLVENVVVGDLLMGPDSLPRRVIGLGHGHSKMYKVSPVKGEPYVVNDEHILSLKLTNTTDKKGCLKKGIVHNISIKEYLGKSNNFKRMAKGYRAGVEFESKEIPIDPYFLGVWLGDGRSRSSEIYNIDEEVISYSKEYAESIGLKFVKKVYKNRCPAYALVNEKCNTFPCHASNLLLNSLRDMNLILNKHIPDSYKINSRNVRLQVLAGLIDTDGSLGSGVYDYISKFKILADDVVFLARSLGFAAYLKECKKTCCNNGVSKTYYRVSISGDVSQIPVKILRKKAEKRKQKKSVLVSGITVEPIGYGEYFGFEISGPDRLFLLGDFTVTHNTVLCKALSRLLAGSNKRVSGMPDSLASDITGCEIILLNGDTKTVQGPLFCNVMLADEINRFPPKAQNAFIEALAEGSVTIANKTYKLHQPFFLSCDTKSN